MATGEEMSQNHDYGYDEAVDYNYGCDEAYDYNFCIASFRSGEMQDNLKGVVWERGTHWSPEKQQRAQYNSLSSDRFIRPTLKGLGRTSKTR